MAAPRAWPNRRALWTFFGEEHIFHGHVFGLKTPDDQGELVIDVLQAIREAISSRNSNGAVVHMPESAAVPF